MWTEISQCTYWFVSVSLHANPLGLQWPYLIRIIEKNKLASLSSAPRFFTISQESHLIHHPVYVLLWQARPGTVWVREEESANSHLVVMLPYSQPCWECFDLFLHSFPQPLYLLGTHVGKRPWYLECVSHSSRSGKAAGSLTDDSSSRTCILGKETNNKKQPKYEILVLWWCYETKQLTEGVTLVWGVVEIWTGSESREIGRRVKLWGKDISGSRKSTWKNLGMFKEQGKMQMWLKQLIDGRKIGKLEQR